MGNALMVKNCIFIKCKHKLNVNYTTYKLIVCYRIKNIQTADRSYSSAPPQTV